MAGRTQDGTDRTGDEADEAVTSGALVEIDTKLLSVEVEAFADDNELALFLSKQDNKPDGVQGDQGLARFESLKLKLHQAGYRIGIGLKGVSAGNAISMGAVFCEELHATLIPGCGGMNIYEDRWQIIELLIKEGAFCVGFKEGVEKAQAAAELGDAWFRIDVPKPDGE
ncbi:MAG: hypothetical protein UT33_C0012G0003 [Candidatus Peregrinibacteria bacterium GW2011_GWC2_39_14]|nr:MAG: hypothetical protein US92_C0003G0030 [Candidatus Peregrinibacteria bacterium GW2011_GWA2_38_36]KKR05198.1 MAG: hypothetical protein UT33_C0012G0003 [Candidatus Peregrinibacteria bacterium GW2011_GWC2_39_14]